MPSTETTGTLDDAWLRTCRRLPVWQSASVNLYRISQELSAWDALILSRTRDEARSQQTDLRLRRYANADGWLDTPTAILERSDDRVLVFDTESLILRLLAPSPAPLDEFLPLALAMVRTLSVAHADGAPLGSLHPIDFAIDHHGGIRLRTMPATGSARTLGVIDEIIYRAPEQLRPVAPQCDSRSDLYALGMILFRHLTGIFPLAANSAIEWRHAHLALAPMDASTMFADLPPVVGRILKRLLAKEPAARYQSALALELDLARCEREWRENRAIGDFDHSSPAWTGLRSSGTTIWFTPSQRYLVSPAGQGMSRRGNCHDNAVAESFFNLLKRERIRRKVYRSRDEARQDVFDYIEMFYNPKRKHVRNGMLSPVEFERQQKT